MVTERTAGSAVATGNRGPVGRTLDRHCDGVDVVSNVGHVASNDDETANGNQLGKSVACALYQVTCQRVAMATTSAAKRHGTIQHSNDACLVV